MSYNYFKQLAEQDAIPADPAVLTVPRRTFFQWLFRRQPTILFDVSPVLNADQLDPSGQPGDAESEEELI
jgi:hypothetical protein